MYLRLSKYSILLLALFFITACVKDKPNHDNKDWGNINLHSPVYFVHEGALSSGNASLSVLDRQDFSYYDNIFETVNDMPIGDILQSAYQHNDLIYLLVNNSDEILVIRATDFKLVKTINVQSPRYFLPISSGLAYVSSLFSNQLYILDTEQNNIIDSVAMPYTGTEQMVLFEDNVYICNWNKNSSKLIQINTETHHIIDEINLGKKAPHSITIDKNHHLWIFSGNPSDEVPASITVYDTYHQNIIKQHEFSGTSEYMKPVMNNQKDTIYYLGVNYDGETSQNGVFYTAVDDEEMIAHSFLTAETYQYFWALGYDPIHEQIYVGDPRGFIQKSKIYIYNRNGKLMHSMSGNIGIGNFYFAE